MAIFVKSYLKKTGGSVKAYIRGGRKRPPTVVHLRTQAQKNSAAKAAGDRARKIQAHRAEMMSRRGWAKGRSY